MGAGKGWGGFMTFLDDGETVPVDWNEYQLTKRIGSSLQTLIDSGAISLNDDEFERIHYGDSENQPEPRKQVRVFGEYKKLNPV
jgi:hypothetical protein